LTARTAGIAAIGVSLALGMTSNLLFLAAFQFRLDWFLEPTRVPEAGATSAELLRWASVLDLIGYYLTTAVLAYVLWQWLRPRNRLIADLSAVAAIGYVLAGGIGAAALAMVGPMLMHDHAEAAAEDRALIAAQFVVLFEVVWRVSGSYWTAFCWPAGGWGSGCSSERICPASHDCRGPWPRWQWSE
jgi:hypothetical protein